MFCPRCGTTNPDTAKTCDICGQDLKATSIEASASPSAVKVATKPSGRPMAATMLGVAMPGQGNRMPPTPPGPPPAAPPYQPPAPAAPAVPMARVASPTGSHPTAPAASQSHRNMQTMLGVAAPAPGSVTPTGPQTPGGWAQPAVSFGGGAQPAATSPSPAAAPASVASVPGVRPVTTPDRAVASPRERLAELLRTQGPSIANPNADLERALIEQYHTAASLLAVAQRAGIARELLGPPPPEGWSERLDQLTSRLMMSQRMKAEDARYVVESWALAFGLLSPLR